MSDLKDNQRVVITGVGMVSPLGANADTSWSRLVRGESATRDLLPGEINDFDRLAEFLAHAPAGAPALFSFADASIDPLTALIRQAAAEALEDAGSPLDEIAIEDVACVVGTSKGALRSLAGHSSAPPDDFDFRWLWPDTPAMVLAADYGIRGPVLAPVAACATGLIAVQRGVDLIRRRESELVIAGSVDASLCSSVLASFRRLGVLSHSSCAQTACKPFDEHRDGFVVGEGGAVVLLESLASAKRRGVRCYAEILSALNLTDPTGLTQIDTHGTIVAKLIRQLMSDARLSRRPDCIHAHGTGTIPNDQAEAAGIAAVFGSDQPLLSASKGAIGHLLGAAGSVELVFALKSLREQQVPPIRNLQHTDAELAIRPAVSGQQPHPLQTVLKLSLGFGGHTAGIVLRRSD